MATKDPSGAHPPDKSVAQMQATFNRLIQENPELAKKDDYVDEPIPLDKSPNDIIRSLQKQLADEESRHHEIQADYKQRASVFAQREAATRKKISQFEENLGNAVEDNDTKAYISKMRSLFDTVMEGLDGVQNDTAKALQEQERALMTTFRAKLSDVTTELETLKVHKGDHSAELKARHARVKEELAKSRDLAQYLDQSNLQLDADTKKLHDKAWQRESDLEALDKELRHVRKKQI